MKKTFVSIAFGVALATSGAAFAAGDMENMDMSSGAKQGGQLTHRCRTAKLRKWIRRPAS